jgi:hypothetical protein
LGLYFFLVLGVRIYCLFLFMSSDNLTLTLHHIKAK